MMKKLVKKRSRYPLALLIILVVNAVAIALALGWLRNALAGYEAHTPRRALDRYFIQLAAGVQPAIQKASGFTPDALNSWGDYFAVLNERFGGRRPEALSYRRKVSTALADDQQLYAVYDGETLLGEVILAPDDSTPSGWAAHSPVEYLPGYTVMAPAAVQVMVEGLELGAAQAVGADPVTISYTQEERPVTVEIFSALSDQSAAPTIVAYETPPTLVEPQFTAVFSGGAGCELVVDRASRTVTVSIPAKQALQEELAAWMEKVAKAYSDFITEDGTLAALRPYLNPGTRLYKDYSEYQTGWYLDHERREFSSVAASDIFVYSDHAFTGHIEIIVTIHQGSKVHTFYPSYDMAFLKVDDRWLLTGLHTRHTEN